MALYEIRLMFEWGGSCLWGVNEAAKAIYGYAEIECLLLLRNETKAKLGELSEIHDEALNWNDPAGPSPLSRGDFEQFESKAHSILQDVRRELRDTCLVEYSPIGEWTDE